MMTRYYCEQCEVDFDDDALPNINKTHHCGKKLKILRYQEKGGDA